MSPSSGLQKEAPAPKAEPAQGEKAEGSEPKEDGAGQGDTKKSEDQGNEDDDDNEGDSSGDEEEEEEHNLVSFPLSFFTCLGDFNQSVLLVKCEISRRTLRYRETLSQHEALLWSFRSQSLRLGLDVHSTHIVSICIRSPVRHGCIFHHIEGSAP